jgi:hypothetical protein
MLFLQDFVLQVHRLDQSLADAQEQSRMLEIDRHSQLRLEEMVVQMLHGWSAPKTVVA